MALEEFEKEEKNEPATARKANNVRHVIMGVLWLFMGVFLLAPARFGYQLAKQNDPFIKAFGVISICYGLFRIYRAYTQKDEQK